MSDHNAAKFLSNNLPTAWLFSGWNCVANTLSLQMAAGKGSG